MVNFIRNMFGAAVIGFVAATGAAAAMPVGQLGADANAAKADTGVQTVRWVCGPYGNCVWRPNRYYRPYGYYGGYRPYYAPRPRYYGYYGYGPRWRRW